MMEDQFPCGDSTGHLTLDNLNAPHNIVWTSFAQIQGNKSTQAWKATHLLYIPLVFYPWQSLLVPPRVLISSLVWQSPVSNVVALVTMETEGKETIPFLYLAIPLAMWEARRQLQITSKNPNSGKYKYVTWSRNHTQLVDILTSFL